MALTRRLRIKYWQIGNETSYDKRRLRPGNRSQRRPSSSPRPCGRPIRRIQLDRPGATAGGPNACWKWPASTSSSWPFTTCSTRTPQATRAGRASVTASDPAATWQVLMKAWEIQRRQDPPRAQMSLEGYTFPLAMTECHFTVPGRHRGDVLSTWAAGVSYARILNNHQRHGDLLEDRHRRRFLRHALAGQRRDDSHARGQVLSHACGTRDATLPPPLRHPRRCREPRARRFGCGRERQRRHALSPCGQHPPHALRARTKLQVDGRTITGGRVFEIADEPMIEVSQLNAADVMRR